MSSVFIDTNIWLYAVIECGEKKKAISRVKLLIVKKILT